MRLTAVSARWSSEGVWLLTHRLRHSVETIFSVPKKFTRTNVSSCPSSALLWYRPTQAIWRITSATFGEPTRHSHSVCCYDTALTLFRMLCHWYCASDKLPTSDPSKSISLAPHTASPRPHNHRLALWQLKLFSQSHSHENETFNDVKLLMA